MNDEAKMTKLAKVQKALEIRGYITVSVSGRDMKARAIKVVDGEWLTDIVTIDLCGYVRIRKTKDAVVRQAEYVIAHEAEIREQMAAHNSRVMAAVMQS